MKPSIKLLALTMALVLTTACGSAKGGACAGIDLTLENYGPAGNKWIYVKNSSNSPKLVTLALVDMLKDGRETDTMTMSVPAKGIAEDKSGTYVPAGFKIEVKSCE